MQDDYLLNTPRLGIRQLTLEDTDALFPILSDEDVMKFSISGPHQDKQQTEAFIENCMAHYAEYGFHLWAIVHLDAQVLIGVGGLLIQEIDGHKEIELSYRLAKEWWGQGLGTEAAEVIRDYGFQRLAMNRLISIIEPENTRSLRVAQKLGMAYERDSIFDEHPVEIHTLAKF